MNNEKVHMNKYRNFKFFGNTIKTNEKNNMEVVLALESLIIEIRKELNP